MRKTKNKEEIAEDYCFTCKDGGHLRVCDYKNCLKAYHPPCVGKDPSFLETDERWTCGWHLCFICGKSSSFQCFCCPNSVCRSCIREAEFVQVKKRMKGFCNNCLKLAILIEDNIDVDSDGGKVDFKDTETYEFLFKDYWEIVKDQEGLTLVDLHAANALLKRGENCKSESDSDKFPEEELMSECDDLEDDCHNEMSLLDDLKVKRGKMKTPIKRCRSKKKYIGWGSEELRGFLTSIGKDTEEPLTQLDASEIVKDYVQTNNLFNPDKKKNKVVVCDDKLYSLFRKKKVKVHKIYSLLESHLAADGDMDDEFSFSSDEDDNSIIRRKWQRTNSDSKIRKSEPNHYRQKVLEPPKSCYASVVEKNIKSVYLRRSLIMNLLKNLETFENKVTGCFVRVKNDPKDFYFRPQNPCQLGQVTGIKKAPHAYKVGETLTDTVLCVSNMCRDIQITMVSDDDFEEEECEDLLKLVKKGLLKRLTVAELEKKIRIVHEDITNHWIDREIVKLQKLIDQANDKGWRRELFEYIDRRELLCTPAERSRLLKEIPQVIADTEEEVKVTTDTLLKSHGENKGGNVTIIEVPPEEAQGNGLFSCENAAEERSEGNGADSHGNAVEGQPEGASVADVEVPTKEAKGPPQRVLSSFLHSFVDSGRAGIPFCPAVQPVLGLSEGDKQCIRDRSCIMARHIFVDKSEEYISAQVNALLHSLDIDSDHRIRGPMHEPFPELEEYWNKSQSGLKSGMPDSADRWVTEFNQQRENGDPEAWAYSFQELHGTNGWVSEFEKEQSQIASFGNMSNISAMEQSRMLAHTLAQNTDPKFQNSKFLQFVSKMSRGELIVDENQIKPATGSISADRADEYQTQYNFRPNSWADQFAHEQLSQGRDKWVDEFAKEHQQQGVDDQWVDEFSKLHVEDWAEEFGQQVSEGALGESSADNWADSYDKYLDEQVLAFKQRSNTSSRVYVFSDMNPYVGHPNPLKEGQELFHKGLLSEAVLALEAEVLKNPDNAEGWRFLGITHAENDDDEQAIASMLRAQEVDPTNLEVLLALGVSHTNELEQEEALKFLYKWLQNHPKYGALTPSEQVDLYYANIARLFNEASQMSPEDADVHIVLGVLYNLSRDYDKAIESFQTALKLKPHDYSLWNKLGATQANSIQSADAILAYQQALDLKPNYVRAWANMGISYANQGLHEESIRYYVRTLSMNPKADNAWQYLRISLSCASRNDMFEACDSRNLDVLQKEFPL